MANTPIEELDRKIKRAKKKLADRTNPKFIVDAIKPTKILTDIISGVAVGAVLGYFIDASLGTIPLFIFLLIVVGASCGVYLIHKDIRLQEKLNNKKNDA